MVFTAARWVVDVAEGKTVCRFVLVVAEATIWEREARRMSLEYMMNNYRQGLQIRSFAQTRLLKHVQGPQPDSYDNSNARPAVDLNHNITQEEKDHYARKLHEDKGKQIRTPWHREGSEKPPVSKLESDSGTMTKGKLLTTPSRMLKLILPLTTRDSTSTSSAPEPLALLVHPQQPLSYLERLIQAELPFLKTKDGRERIPNVYFRAEDSLQDSLEPSKPTATPVSETSESVVEDEYVFQKADEIHIDGKTERTGKLDSPSSTTTPEGFPPNRHHPSEAAALRGGHGEGGVESYSGLGHEAPSDSRRTRNFVRWSSSTEIGDFIRDAARGQEFAIEIEGAPHDIRVGVPSFNDRTYYLRMRLRKTSKRIADMAKIKKECDELAHRAAQRVAMGGFGVLCGWWYLVYRLTFETELGWDVMEPVTYLVGLSSLIAGYVWFLYHNREVSYRSAMNFTISRRQQKLYSQRGFDLQKWEALVAEGNELRKEIKAVANEYDVEWDELEDEKHEEVAEALREERKKKEKEEEEEGPQPAGTRANEGPAKGSDVK
ncbi:uncharacterized protein EI97DRAFT_450000 [Westerdykella ornata]|uniref:Calcium uniporter protein, mitochondrial n=1 Tax=Westerdykella ornata TaxID=318751 RepID=A0A6A6JL46_WESOR|nr:uncharacterized protein EI97DRAFT_450000 [Westerdykella ornata]KAF2276668.1 hypothetical protein EI97DRAFT_450000 [Westerdykella ornata]